MTSLPEQVKRYLVGGAVRDALLGLQAGDRDWVVVGTSVEQMLAAGFKQVGRDFPVFLHPHTGEEYALARTERKSGRGYTGFIGNLLFIDTQGNSDPSYDGLGSRFSLVYLTAEEYALI